MTWAQQRSTPGIVASSSTWAAKGATGLEPLVQGGDLGLLGFDVVQHLLQQEPGFRGLDMVRRFMQLEKVADALIPAGSGCIAAGQQLARSQVEL
jgi:hypothetical protein